jgi:hypothetical protein
MLDAIETSPPADIIGLRRALTLALSELAPDQARRFQVALVRQCPAGSGMLWDYVGDAGRAAVGLTEGGPSPDLEASITEAMKAARAANFAALWATIQTGMTPTTLRAYAHARAAASAYRAAQGNPAKCVYTAWCTARWARRAELAGEGSDIRNTYSPEFCGEFYTNAMRILSVTAGGSYGFYPRKNPFLTPPQ